MNWREWFAVPRLLWLLPIFLPAMAVFFWRSSRKREELAGRFIRARLLPGLLSGFSPARQKLRFTLLIAAVGCAILALARPRWGFVWEEVRHRGLDIVIAIDTSKSMLAQDVPPNRLARAKLAALDLMQQAKSDRLGLVAFAGNAFLQCPLTIDDAAFQQSVAALDVNTIPEGGTALADAIDTALASFKEGDHSKAMVLMTDGEDQDSGAIEAAKRAAAQGLSIFTIGVGTKEGDLLVVTDEQGHTDYIRDEQGNVHKSHLNEQLLQDIANATHGCYYPLVGAKTMDALYTQWLAPKPKSESDDRLMKHYQERYRWPLAAAIILLVSEILLPERSREPKSRTAAAPRRAAVPAAAALLLLLALPAAVFGSPSSALREYKSGQYDQALKDYQDLLQHKADDPRLRFNAGTSAYRAGRFDEAAKQLGEALASPDLKLQEQTYYNRGNTYYYLGDANPDPQKKQEDWQNALRDFQSASKLNQQDADATFNYQFVKKKLEELKKQQEQQKQNKSDQQQNQDQQQQDKQNQNSDKSHDQKQQQQQQKQDSQDQQSKSDPKQDSSQQQQSAQQKEEDKKQEQAAEKDQEEKQDRRQQQAAAQPGEKSDETNAEGRAYAPNEMTQQQARQLLDAQKNDDMLLPVKKPDKPLERRQPLHDW